jgi:hypothetical protein
VRVSVPGGVTVRADVCASSQGVSLWQIESRIENSLRKVIAAAVYTFVSSVEVCDVAVALSCLSVCPW